MPLLTHWPQVRPHLRVNVDKFHQELLKAITNAAQTVKEVPSIGGADFEKFAVTIEYSRFSLF